MSRAFVKEDDVGAGAGAGADLPDRPISAHRNLVTPEGLAQMEAEIDHLRRSLAAIGGARDPSAATLSRDLRYWTARRASAECVESAGGGEVRFGSRVTIEREDGRQQVFRLVGEDEADPKAGTLSYVSPLAGALIGKGVGDAFDFQGQEIAIVGIA